MRINKIETVWIVLFIELILASPNPTVIPYIGHAFVAATFALVGSVSAKHLTCFGWEIEIRGKKSENLYTCISELSS